MNIKNNKVLNIIWRIIKGITTTIVIIIVLTIILQRVSNNKLTLGGFSIYTVVTKSMVPKYQVGDMLLSQRVDTDTIKVGDDVVYLGNTDTFNGKIITHQVIQIEGEGQNKIFHTKGIANIVEDPTISGNQIYGKIVAKLTVLSLIAKVISNIYGMFFLVIIPIVILIFGVVIDVINEKKS
ncbi:MAG: signal peptidase I [Bacilli bacterium]|nr:signal peptidase I [Bacilli bacterium]